MCLYINTTETTTCKEQPITCYKVVRRNPYFTDNWISLIMTFRYKHGKYRTEKLKIIPPQGNILNYSVKEGFHSYVNLEHAQRVVDIKKKFYPEYTNSKVVILKCRIPVGAEYVEGCDINGRQNYVSSEIEVLCEL